MQRLQNFPRHSLGYFPTPLIHLKNLEKFLGGPRIFMKRDDLTGLGMGGNKTRKLEYLIGDALSQGSDCVITGGAAQSNHCRQTAAAAAACGLECHLALGGTAPDVLDGNLLLDMLFGAHLHWSADMRKGENIPEIVKNLEDQGKKPYVIPYGGSNQAGALGYVEAMSELHNQLQISGERFNHIFFASSSGGTHSGMLVGKRLLQETYALHGINIDKDEIEGESLDSHIINLANKTATALKLDHTFTENDVYLNSDYTGEGYGVVGELEKETILLLARQEGILLDPVYTARARGGMIDMIRQGKFTKNETLLFWHTGGNPALFAYGNTLL